MVDTKKKVNLIVCDIDSTIFPHHDIVADISQNFLNKVSLKLGIEKSVLKNEIREASKDSVKLDFLSRSPSLLKSEIPSIKEAVKTPLKSKMFDYLVHEWEVGRAEKTKLYDGVDKVFADAKKSGARIAILTAGPKSATIFNLFLLSKAKENKLDVNMIDMIVCRDDPKQCVFAKYDVNTNPSLKHLDDKTFAIPHEMSKDKKGVLDFIIKQMKTKPEDTLMVGDSSSDAKCAKNAGSMFVFQVEGAKKKQSSVDFYKEFLGEEHDFLAVKEKVEKTIPKKERIDFPKGFGDFDKYFEFAPAEKNIENKQTQVKEFRDMIKKISILDIANNANNTKGR